ncbi:MAG TPA: hypothetical protein VMV10_07225 [Pirellulales bacterium]|nr:hypothetical protein [Pirellulales bacterium]
MHATAILACFLLASPAAEPERYFEITVIDRQTGRGVPLVELSTVNGIRYVTDSNGVVAFDEPGLLGQKVFFYVKSHGYEFHADGFGFRGTAVETKPGGKVTLEIDRKNIAERLYRITGAGIYRDSALTGRPAPIDQPLINARVLGSDSVLTAVFQGKLFWFWGDTNRAAYPLGNFHATGATSELPKNGGLEPSRGVNFNYFKNEDGFARGMAPMPGDGPTWLDALTVLNSADGRERMFAAYLKVKPPLTVYARGLAEFNLEKEAFEHVADFDIRSPVFPSGHPFVHEEADGKNYVYFADPFPIVRVAADADALANLFQYEAYTCLKAGSRVDPFQVDESELEKVELDRDAEGRLHWSWRRNAAPLGPRAEAKLIEMGRIKPQEARLRLVDAASNKPVVAHRGSVYWNDFRKRWLLIAAESEGTSPLGEIWLAEAESLAGPWRNARKIVTHDKYSFYNPKQHPQFDEQGGRIIYFEGTYTQTFSGNPEATPRYEYNQIMYRLDLADERLRTPVAGSEKPQ